MRPPVGFRPGNSGLSLTFLKTKFRNRAKLDGIGILTLTPTCWASLD